MKREELEQLAEPDWCEKCHNYIVPMSAAEYLWSWVCWFLTMYWPDRWFMSRAHAAILPWSGNIAYRCICWRNQSLRSKDPTP